MPHRALSNPCGFGGATGLIRHRRRSCAKLCHSALSRLQAADSRSRERPHRYRTVGTEPAAAERVSD